MKLQAVRGTRDILPGEIERWQRVETLARELFARYGFLEIRTPAVEATELFARGVGASTDIVRKEMFTFMAGDDSISLRPEMTAPVVRAFIQHGLSRVPGADRLYYLGPMFRYERPQKGRQRQFHQVGVEVFGSDDPYVDAETIEMLVAFLAEAFTAIPDGEERGAAGTRTEDGRDPGGSGSSARADGGPGTGPSARAEGVARSESAAASEGGGARMPAGLELVINSVGCSVCRPLYRQALVRWLEERHEATVPRSAKEPGTASGAPQVTETGGPAVERLDSAPSGSRLSRLCDDCRRRLVENPLRVFDCKVEADQALLASAPTILDHLCEACRTHFAAVREWLGAFGIGYRVNPRLVRGLDYYVRTAFEIIAEDGLGAQNSLMGGGRYDGLMKELGGPDLPGFGWALGLERLMLLLDSRTPPGAENEEAPLALRTDLYLAHMGDEAARLVALLARDLRARGISVRLDPRPKGLGAQLKRAVREGARYTLIVGDDEIRSATYQLKDMKSQDQAPVAARDRRELALEIETRIGSARERMGTR